MVTFFRLKQPGLSPPPVLDTSSSIVQPWPAPISRRACRSHSDPGGDEREIKCFCLGNWNVAFEDHFINNASIGCHRAGAFCFSHSRWWVTSRNRPGACPKEYTLAFLYAAKAFKMVSMPGVEQLNMQVKITRRWIECKWRSCRVESRNDTRSRGVASNAIWRSCGVARDTCSIIPTPPHPPHHSKMCPVMGRKAHKFVLPMRKDTKKKKKKRAATPHRRDQQSSKVVHEFCWLNPLVWRRSKILRILCMVKPLKVGAKFKHKHLKMSWHHLVLSQPSFGGLSLP